MKTTDIHAGYAAESHMLTYAQITALEADDASRDNHLVALTMFTSAAVGAMLAAAFLYQLCAA